MREYIDNASWKKAYLEEKRKREILEQQYQTANKWVELFCRGIPIKKRLEEWKIEKIIIYGASEFTLRLLSCCEKENINVAAITDKKITVMGGFYKDIPLVPVNNVKDYLDDNVFVVVAAMGYFEEIKSELEKMGYGQILSLKKLLYGKNRE